MHDFWHPTPRRTIIDSAFKMTEELVSASTRFAHSFFFDITQQALSESDQKSGASSK